MIKNILKKARIPDDLPQDVEDIIEGLKRSRTKEGCAKKAYDILSERYRGYRAYTYLRLFDLFHSDVGYLWSRKGFLHCNNLNYLLRILLIRSGMFSESDIVLKWTRIWVFSPHQYLRVRIGRRWTDIDLWGKAYGIPFGAHAQGFH
jgi:hypothetical protein